MKLGTEEGQWGPMVSTVPLTEYRGNIAAVWLDKTPVGMTAQIAVGRKTLVVGWMHREFRPKGKFCSRGYAAIRRPKY